MHETTTDKSDEPVRWQDKTLKVAGYSYLAGDIAMMAAGKARHDKTVVTGALTWLTGGLMAARYGNPDHDKQVQIEADKLETFMRRQGVTIPDSTREQSALLHKKSFGQKIEQFLYEHPSEALNAMYGIGAAMLLHKGIKQIGTTHELIPKSFRMEDLQKISSNFWIGATVLSGASAGMLIREDPQARKKAENGTWLDKAVAVVKEKPLRLSSGLYTANNAFLLLQGVQDVKAANTLFKDQALKPHHFSIPQLAIYLFANSMLLLSSRNQISNKGFSGEDMAKLEEAAAQVIVAQPANTQSALLSEIATFMAAQKGIHHNAPELAQHLADRVVAITKEHAQSAVTQTQWSTREAGRPETLASVVSR